MRSTKEALDISAAEMLAMVVVKVTSLVLMVMSLMRMMVAVLMMIVMIVMVMIVTVMIVTVLASTTWNATRDPPSSRVIFPGGKSKCQASFARWAYCEAGPCHVTAFPAPRLLSHLYFFVIGMAVHSK